MYTAICTQPLHTIVNTRPTNTTQPDLIESYAVAKARGNSAVYNSGPIFFPPFSRVRRGGGGAGAGCNIIIFYLVPSTSNRYSNYAGEYVARVVLPP